MLSHRKTTLSLSLAFSVVSTAAAGPVGVFTTNTFGFSGTVTEYASQADFDSDQNGTDSPISFRPVDIFINNGVAGFSSSLYDPTYANVILASDLVLYDVDSSTDTSIGFSFVETVSGSYDITLNLAGSNSDWNNDLSTLPTVPDPAAWPSTETRSFLDYSLDVTALGVGGTLYPQGLFSDSNPSGVSGSFRGAFYSASSASASPSFYRFDFDLAMNTAVTTPQSNFAVQTVPTPTTMLLLATGLFGLYGVRATRTYRTRFPRF